MTIVEIILSIVCLILFTLLCLSVYRIVQLVDVQTRLETQVEESLDILDRTYKEITVATMTEVFSDEPVVRKVIEAIKSSQVAVMLVANKLVSFGEETEDEG